MKIYDILLCRYRRCQLVVQVTPKVLQEVAVLWEKWDQIVIKVSRNSVQEIGLRNLMNSKGIYFR